MAEDAGSSSGCDDAHHRIASRRFSGLSIRGSIAAPDAGRLRHPDCYGSSSKRAGDFLLLLFRVKLNDTTNAFKAYRRVVIDGCRPLIAPHFYITIELPLKAIVRGYSWTVIPVSWRNRRSGASKFRIKEMGSRYFFISLYVWLEKYFSRGDYKRR
jgi:dolichol-phosphate mannosyltransferase